MKKIFVSFLIVGLAGTGAHARCTYFRLSADLLHCESADTKSVNTANPYLATQDLPELQETNSQALVEVNCSCEYSLSGSDPSCDMEQTLERASVIGADNVTTTCRQGKSLCRDVCPSRLP